ncbi:MAG: radical SAM protein [Culicoidibacterales bacterium]
MQKTISTKNIIVKSNLPAADYVINPYVGCTHDCQYCYAVFMKRFYQIDKPWGKFVFEKQFPPIKNIEKYHGKKVLLSSVTDPYQPIEKKRGKTRQIIEQFCQTDVHLEVLTKSNLVERDIDLFQQIPHMLVGMSMSLINPQHAKKMERGCPSYSKRLATIRTIAKNGIDTYAFISPIFPFLTDYKQIILDVKDTVKYIYVENLNLRGSYKETILASILEIAPEHHQAYQKIYINSAYKQEFWERVEHDIRAFAKQEGIEEKLKIFFYHGKK